ncbi:MAG: O-antigen ligase family protein [Candidatus Doudnabacteria bacterium]|nr:O-antigen ligase family protein [Candidatus Doudnabacteria bacterium]
MDYFIALTLLLTPAYALRFNLFGFPANFLMVWVVFVWIIFILVFTAKHEWQNFFNFIKNFDKKILILTGLFFLAGLISLSVKGFDQKKIGQFVVLFLQPISLFFISRFVFDNYPKVKSLLLATCYLLLATMGLYAILQYFTLLGLPPMWWGNSTEPKRALAFFSHPNFYALFSAPLLAFLIPDALKEFSIFPPSPRLRRTGNFQFSKIIKPLLWLIGAIGLLLSLSRAGWLGLGVAGLIYLFIAAEKPVKKIASVIIVFIIIIIASVPNLRWRFVLPFYGEKSAVSRLSLWNTGVKAIKEAPIVGLGLTGFAKQWPRLNTDPNLDSHNFPHNIFLDLWVETGIIGLISLIGLMGLMIFRGLSNRADIFKLGASLFLIALITQGFIDNPYFKNDLAMVFWIILSLAI